MKGYIAAIMLAFVLLFGCSAGMNNTGRNAECARGEYWSQTAGCVPAPGP
ncbi:MAG TPA: hypothetical protein VLS90_19780 [Thermodesulfobacteriota bacterium]|nr:hypothetical protein [Thermodesulfobacteriota bacterium]